MSDQHELRARIDQQYEELERGLQAHSGNTNPAGPATAGEIVQLCHLLLDHSKELRELYRRVEVLEQRQATEGEDA